MTPERRAAREAEQATREKIAKAMRSSKELWGGNTALADKIERGEL